MNLDALALKYGTDKSSEGHWYTHHYDTIFRGIRRSVESVLEVGVGSGCSIRMWMEYFPNAVIFGVDQNNINGDFGPRVKLHQYEQTDDSLRDVFASLKLDVIVDDCSHEEEKTLKTLTNLFPLLEPKGWYVIEDMEMGSFPLKFGQWIAEHEVDRIHIFRNRSKSSNIYFIRK